MRAGELVECDDMLHHELQAMESDEVLDALQKERGRVTRRDGMRQECGEPLEVGGFQGGSAPDVGEPTDLDGTSSDVRPDPFWRIANDADSLMAGRRRFEESFQRQHVARSPDDLDTARTRGGGNGCASARRF